MDRITEQLIRIEAKLELLIDLVKAKKQPKELISYDEYHRRRDEMAKQQEENKSK